MGGDADVTVIDPSLEWTIDVNHFRSKSRNCPFDDWNVSGRAVATLVGGEIRLLRDLERLKGASDVQRSALSEVGSLSE